MTILHRSGCFWTRQHGDDVTCEVTRAKHGDDDGARGDW